MYIGSATLFLKVLYRITMSNFEYLQLKKISYNLNLSFKKSFKHSQIKYYY
jgi:hypothetical protein